MEDAGRDGLPRYDELPAAAQGGRSGWGLFGADDSVGLLNLQTNEEMYGRVLLGLEPNTPLI